MEPKQSHSAPKEAESPRVGSGKKAVGFFREVKQELKRIEWTTKEELKVYTTIVLVSMILLGMYIYVADLMIQGVLNGINFLLRAVMG